MKLYNCRLSFEEEIEAETEEEAMEEFISILDNLGMGWEQDNTKIKEIEQEEDNVEY